MTEDKLKGMTYAGVGVDYDGGVDGFKRLCQSAGRATASQLERHGFREVPESRGESAYLVDCGDHYLAFVDEGLGTKHKVADAMLRLTGKSYYDQLVSCLLAMTLNDLGTSGAEPMFLSLHHAVGSSKWFAEEGRSRDLSAGMAEHCIRARTTWGPGETPVLVDVVMPEDAVMSSAAVGIIKPKWRRITGRPEAGDQIILLEHTGIGANGLTLARKIADKLPEGYLTKLPSGRTYGEVLLDPTPIVTPIISDLLTAGVRLHAAINITGHGWRKLMRSPEPLAYVIDHLPTQREIFAFMMAQGPVDIREAYGNLNMGALYALMMPKADVGKAFDVLHAQEQPDQVGAVYAGSVEASATKRVVIRPVDIVFEADELQVR